MRRATKTPAQSVTREVIGVKSMSTLVREGWGLGLSKEPPVVRQHMDGTWTIHYPEEGWIQSSPGEQWPYTQAYWPGATKDDPKNLEAAIAHARVICQREPKVEWISEMHQKRLRTMASQKS